MRILKRGTVFKISFKVGFVVVIRDRVLLCHYIALAGLESTM